MANAALTVPYPSDKVEVLGSAVDTVGQAAGHITEKVGTLGSAVSAALAGWEGAAAAGFAVEHEIGKARLKALGNAHQHLHEHLTKYHAGVTTAQTHCKTAHGNIGSALGEYSSAASGAVGHLLGGLENVISKLWHMITHPWEIVEYGLSLIKGHHEKAQSMHSAISGWAMPGVSPVLEHVAVGSFAGPLLTAAPEVKSSLEGIGGFFVSHLTDGIEDLFHWGEGLLEAGMDLLHKAEDAVADAIAAARKLAADALHTLENLGRELASAIETAVVDEFKLAWKIGKEAVHGAEVIAKDVAHVAVTVAKDEVAGWKEIGEDINHFVDEHAKDFKIASTVLGWVAAGAGVAALIPGLDVIAAPVAAAAIGLKTADDVLLASTGNGEWSSVVWDGVEVATLGVGTAGAGAAKGAVEAAEDGEKAARLGKAADDVESAGRTIFRVGEDGETEVQTAEQAAGDLRSGAKAADDAATAAKQWGRNTVHDFVHPVKTFAQDQAPSISGKIAMETKEVFAHGKTAVAWGANAAVGSYQSVVDIHDLVQDTRQEIFGGEEGKHWAPPDLIKEASSHGE